MILMNLKKFFIDQKACERLQLGYDWALQAQADAISSLFSIIMD